MFSARLVRHALAAVALIALAGCTTNGIQWSGNAGPSSQAVIRIDAGSSTPFKDSAGNTWLADTGFEGGDVAERDETLAIANTKDPGLFRTEHYGMDSFTQKLPNGHYTVKLYFAETYTEGITQAGERVFTITVQDKVIKDFDVWAKAGGALKAYVETVPVDVKAGTLTIKFEAGTQNAEINAIEIIPG